MKRKGWVIPILVFIISFSGLFFYQKTQNTVSLATTTELPPILWSKSPSNINKILYSYGNKNIEAVRKNNSWFLSNFNNKQADDLYIYTILEHFSAPVFDKVIEISPKDLTIYGIDESCPTVTLYDSDNTEYVLTKGKSIDDYLDYVYAPLSDTVYSISSDVFKDLTITETDWLNKKLLNFDLKNVSKICFSYKSAQVTLTPVASSNKEVTFTSDNINDSLAAEFVHFLDSSKIEQFITDNANTHTLNVYGFSSPTLKCTIYLNDGNNITLTIGKINQSENLCYATVNASTSIVAIPYFDFSQFSSMYAALHETDNTQLG